MHQLKKWKGYQSNNQHKENKKTTIRDAEMELMFGIAASLVVLCWLTNSSSFNNWTLPRFFQLLTWTSQRKSVNTANKNALKIVKMPILNVISWTLTRILLRKAAEFYRRLDVGGKFEQTLQTLQNFATLTSNILACFNVLPLNLVSFPILRPFFQQYLWIFAKCECFIQAIMRPHTLRKRSGKS